MNRIITADAVLPDESEGFFLGFKPTPLLTRIIIIELAETLDHCNANASSGLPIDFDEDFDNEEGPCGIMFGDFAFGSELIYKYANEDFVLLPPCYIDIDSEVSVDIK
uniref:Uncharacterized protein n=1 Tax=Glossina austeni TaxID=7395 RepID=A0A1A9VF75_GLOAU